MTYYQRRGTIQQAEPERATDDRYALPHQWMARTGRKSDAALLRLADEVGSVIDSPDSVRDAQFDLAPDQADWLYNQLWAEVRAGLAEWYSCAWGQNDPRAHREYNITFHAGTLHTQFDIRFWRRGGASVVMSRYDDLIKRDAPDGDFILF
jgi:hypothetical protein